MDSFKCEPCKLSFKSKKIFDNHKQYAHFVNMGLPKCMYDKCKNRPLYNCKTVCASHNRFTGNKIKFMNIRECKKYDNRNKGLIPVERVISKKKISDEIIDEIIV